MNEQRNTLLAVGVGVIIGIGLLLGINSIVTNSMLPAVTKIGMLAESQARTERLLEQKISGLERKIEAFDQKMSMLALARGGDARPGFPSNAYAQPPAQGGGCGGAPGQPSSEDLNKVYTLNVGTTPVKGKKEAPVIITMFADFECPFCARFYEPVKEVLNAYPDKVKFMVKNFPLGFHQNAVPAAKFALAANLQGKYFETIDLLMKNKADVSEAKVKEYVQTLALDENKLKEDLKNKDAEFDKQIKDDMNLGGQSDVRGTPTFFLNGKKSNARDVSSWKAEIDAILSGK